MTSDYSTIISARMHELTELIQTYPIYIPISAVAEILHVRPDALRAAIDQGRCPFGFSWQLGDRPAYKIPTITFFAWLTKGVFPLAA